MAAYPNPRATRPRHLASGGRDTIVRSLTTRFPTIDAFEAFSVNRQAGTAAGFCQAMQLEISDSVYDRRWDDGPSRKWTDFPWVTLVVGSGPVGLPRSFWAVADRLPRLVRDTIEEAEYGDGINRVALTNHLGGATLDRVEDFLNGVRKENIGEIPPRRDATAAPAATVSEFAAGLVVVAAQLTTLYHKVNLAASRPVARWGSDSAQVGRDVGQGDVASEVGRTRTAIDFTRQKVREWPRAARLGRRFRAAVVKLLDDVDGDLRDADVYRVGTEDLRHLTDLAWQSLVWDVCGNTYPGWTELLLDLVLLQDPDDHGAIDVRSKRRPRWRRLTELSSQIATFIQPATLQSWEDASAPDQPDPSQVFYDTAARVLWQQAAAGEESRQGRQPEPRSSDNGNLDQLRMTAAGLPKPVAFVTSFDLELEMALLRNRPAGGERRISVVVPVYLWNTEEDEGEFLWLEGVIELPDRPLTGEEALHCLTNPVTWRVMYQGRYDLPEHPVIVRLTGSPLMNLADADAAAPRNEREEREVADETLGADLRALKLKLDRDDMFVHSATVDEYLALRQAESEYFWVYSRSTFANITSRALPKALLACREPGPVRFWVMVGVPLQDAAVRLRVLSQMSGRRFMMSGLGEIPGYPRPRPAESARSRGSEIAGLSINWRLDDEETVLLISLGMRVINDGRAEQISDRLRHYAWHLGGFATGRLGRAKRDRCPEELDGEAKNR